MCRHSGLIRLILAAAAVHVSGMGSSLTLTPEGIADGFHLTSFIAGIPNPYGVAVTANRQVLVFSVGDKTNYLFADADGQILANAIDSKSFDGYGSAFASSHGSVWATGIPTATGQANGLAKLNNDGSVNTAYYPVGLSINRGIWTNPANSHLIAAGGTYNGGGLFDIDVSGSSPTFRVINSHVTSDNGVAVSPDGDTVYTTGGGVFGFSIATGEQVFGPVPVSGALGVGVISSTNALNGQIIASTQFGTVVIVSPVTGTYTVIASGGTRGEYVALDPSNGSLFLPETLDVFRLDCGPDCAIGSSPPPGGVPEPASFVLLGTGIASLVLFRFCRKAGSSVAVCLLLSASMVRGQSATPKYTVTDLGTIPGLPDDTSTAYAINSSGTVVGISGNLNPRVQAITPAHAYVWIPTSPNATTGRITDLGGPGGFICGVQRFDTFALAINDSNEIVGSAMTASNPDCSGIVERPVLFSRGNITDVVGLGGSSNVASAINNAGVVAGIWRSDVSVPLRVWVYDVAVHDVGALPGFPLTQNVVINSARQIAGWGSSSDFSRSLAFVHTGLGQITASDDMPALGGSNTAVHAINDSGVVVGYSELASGQVHGFSFSGGRIVDLGTLPGTSGSSTANGINNAGDIVGGAQAANFDSHAVLWKNGGALIDLNTVIDSKSGWVLTIANAINTAGQIVGQGLINGHYHAFLLTPETGLASFTLKSKTTCGTTQTTGTVTLVTPAGGNGTSITIISNHPSVADGPPTVTVQPDQTTASFPITTNQVSQDIDVTIQVLLNGQSLSATLTVKPLLQGIQFVPSEVDTDGSIKGSVCTLGSMIATVSLACPAPRDETLLLSSDHQDLAAVPRTLVIPKNATSGTISIAGGGVAVDTDASITATLDADKSSKALTIHPILGNLAINPATVAGSAGATGTVSLTFNLTNRQACVAPKGGLTVNLLSDNADVARPSVPSITIAAGAQVGTFRIITTTPTPTACATPLNSDGSCTVNISAHAASSAQTAPVKVTQPAAGPRDISQLVSVLAGGFRFDRATGRYLQQIQIFNQPVSLVSFPAPISLVLDYFHPNDNNPDGWTLVGARDAGSRQALQIGSTDVAPVGRPYVRLFLNNLPAPGVFNPGDVLTINLVYANPTNGPITWSPVILQGY